MKKIEYVTEPIDSLMLSDYSEFMHKLIFNAKMFDGQKNGESYGNISKRSSEVSAKKRKLELKFFRYSQRYNAPIKEVNIILDEGFQNFDSIPDSPEKAMIDMSGTGDFIEFIVGENGYIPKKNKKYLISRWCKLHRKKLPKNRDELKYYFNINLELSLRRHLSQVRVNDIEKMISLGDNLIYCYNPLKPFRKKSFKKFKKYFKNKQQSYQKSKEKLSKALNKSDRGYALVDWQTFFKVEEEYVFVFYSKFFLTFLDELYDLHRSSPENFNTGAEILLNGLFNQMKGKEKFQGLHFMKNIDAFKLGIQQNYAYFGTLDKGLRIDLYRNIVEEKNNSDKLTFEGGVFHALRHFHINGKPLSATYQGGTEYKEDIFFSLLMESFLSLGNYSSKNIKIPCGEKEGYSYNLEFYQNPNVRGLYSLNTVVYKKK